MRKRLPYFLFYSVIVLVVVVSVISFVSALSWIHKPFAGFLVYRIPFVGSMGSFDWPGIRAGLKTMERIVSTDERPIEKGLEVLEIATQKPPGTPIQHTLESRGEVRSVVIKTARFGLKDFAIVFLIPFAGGIVLLGLGSIVYLLKPNVSTSWVFFIFCVAVSIYMVTGFEMQSTYRFGFLNYFVNPFMGATLFHIGLTFPYKRTILSRYSFLEYLVYLPASIVAAGYLLYFFTFHDGNTAVCVPDIHSVNTANRLFSFACVMGLIVLLIHSVYRATSSLARQRAKMILFGVTIAFLPSAVIMTMVFVIKVNFHLNFLVFFVIFFPASIAYSILRHNLFEADAIIRRTVGYAVVTLIVVGSYMGVSLSLNVFLGKYQLAQSRVFPILFTLGVILIFNPLRNRIQAVVDRVFFRKEYEYGAIVEKVSGAMTSLLELPQILRRLTQTFIEDMFINTSSIMLLTSDGTQFQVLLADGERKQEVEKITIKRHEPLMEIVEREKKELTKYDVLEDPKYEAISQSCATDFDALHASLMVPLVFQNRVIGSLNLGEKKSGQAYNIEDIDLLRTLAHQGAVAIENARLFQENLEKQRMEEELNIARDLQMSMLPATCPEIRGFKIAATSTPAREVGGDFYDFFKMDDERLALIVGDVTGKSVSGALVMSAARSVFRMLSEEQKELRVGDIMVRANRRFKKDMASGMFIALLYASLNAQDKSVRVCSAGQTQPIHLSAKTGEAGLVETVGESFPLGILEKVDYQETRLQVEPGDRVIFYTDGIVEAMNKQKEIFGFNRLLEVVQGSRSMTADSLLKEILDKLNEFAGSAAQHDDLTVIVVSVED